MPTSLIETLNSNVTSKQDAETAFEVVRMSYNNELAMLRKRYLEYFRLLASNYDNATKQSNKKRGKQRL